MNYNMFTTLEDIIIYSINKFLLSLADICINVTLDTHRKLVC